MAKSKIATAYVQVVPSADGIKGKLTSAFGSEGTEAGGSFGSGLISKVKGLIAAAGLGKVLSSAISAGADMQQSLGGIETLFKDSADVVIENAKNAYKTAGMSANDYMETVTSFSASLLQGLSGDTEKAASVADMALTDMSDNANKMGTSMELIQNAYQGFAKQNYTMLDNLKLGYGGTKTEMERLLADAQKLTGVEYDISNLSDVYEAIHVIQGEMGITGTTAQEASSTFSGSFASMKAAATDLLANLTLGEDIGPSLQALGDTVFTFVTGNLLPMVGSALQSLPEVLSGALSMAIQGLNLVADNAETIVQMGIDLISGIGNSIVTALPLLADAAVNIVTAIGNAIITTDWLQIGTDAINSLSTSLSLAATEILGTDGSVVQSVLDAISSGLPSILEGGVSIVVELANGLLSALPGFLTTAGELMSQLLDTILSALPDMLASGISLIGELATGLLSNLPAVLTSAAGVLAELLATIGSHLPDLLQSGLSLIGELAAGLIQAIPQVVASIPQVISSIIEVFGQTDWLQLGKDIINGLINGIGAMAGALWDAAVSVASSALDAIKSFFGIASPSKVMRDEVGKFIPAGVAVGISNNTKPLTDAVNDMADLTTNSLNESLVMDTALALPVSESTYRNNYFTINVYGAKGQSEDELADIVMQRIQLEVAKSGVKLA